MSKQISFKKKRMTVITVLLMVIGLGICLSGCNEKTNKEKREPGEEISRVPAGQHFFQDEIIISVFWPPMLDFVNDIQFKYMQDAHIDLMEYGSDPIFNKASSVQEMLALCEKYDIYVTLYDNRSNGWQKISNKNIQKIVSDWKEYKGVAGFFLVDEPRNANPYGDAVKAIRSEFPTAICQLNMLPAWALADPQAHAEDWISSAGIGNLAYLSYDEYPFGMAPGSRPTMFSNMDLIRKIGLKYGVDTACYLQSISNKSGFRDPTVSETRYHASAALAYGFKNLKYFTWITPVERSEDFTNAIINPDGSLNERYDGIVDINTKIKAVSKILGRTDAMEIYHTTDQDAATSLVPSDYFIRPKGDMDALISYMSDRYEDTDYIMIVNKDFEEDQELTFTLDGLTLVEVTTGQDGDTFSGKTLKADFEAGGFRLYRIEKGGIRPGYYDDDEDNLALGKPVYSSASVGEDGWYNCKAVDGRRYSVDSSRGFKFSEIFEEEENYFLIDLKRVKDFNRIDIYPGGERGNVSQLFPLAYEIFVSSDGEEYTSVCKFSRTGDIMSVPSHTFETVKGRYVKIVFTEFPTIDGVTGGEIGEIEIYNDDGSIPEAKLPQEVVVPEGDNLVLVAKIKASSDVGQWGWSKDNINDGDTASGWSSAVGVHINDPYGEEWITLDMRKVKEFNTVVVYPVANRGGAYFPESFEILVSDDNKDFKSVYVHKDTPDIDKEDPRIITLDSNVSGQYIKILAKEMTQVPSSPDGYLFQIGEVEVFCL